METQHRKVNVLLFVAMESFEEMKLVMISPLVMYLDAQLTVFLLLKTLSALIKIKRQQLHVVRKKALTQDFHLAKVIF